MLCVGLAGSVCVLFVRPETMLCAGLAGSVCVSCGFVRPETMVLSGWSGIHDQ